MRSSRMQTLAISLMSIMAFAHVSCAATADRRPVRETAGAGAYSSFGVDLYREMLKERPGENIFISPASIGFALAMTSNGARGETMDAMARVLHVQGRSLAEVNREDSNLIARTNAPVRGVELSVANSLWAKLGVDFNKDFLATNERFYGAEIKSIAFNGPPAAARVNEWVALKTKDRITEIVDSVDDRSILFLINAIYFKGTWTKEFDRKLSLEASFYLPSGAEKKVPMMHQNADFLYLKGDGFQAASLPYGDGRMSMYVFLPDDRTGLEDFHAKLSADAWDAWMGRFVNANGRIAIPRFRLEYKASLRKSLTDLGMGVAFDGGAADFGGMIRRSDANAYIHDVVHKTFVEVNEKGTEAAAATSVEVRLTSVMEPVKPFEMVCDHPFFFAIRDNETGLVLFMGSVVNPQ
jgi:serine protease inhibitor